MKTFFSKIPLLNKVFKSKVVEHTMTDNNEETLQHSSLNTILIKGNINSRGEKVYHIPGGRFYDVVKNPTETFNTEAEAIQAGFRKSKQ